MSIKLCGTHVEFAPDRNKIILSFDQDISHKIVLPVQSTEGAIAAVLRKAAKRLESAAKNR